MILVSAIKFLIKATGDEVILCGARHKDIFKQIKSLGFGVRQDYKELEQGFIDHNNNFLSRIEAFEHAKECGQLCTKIIYERENGSVGGRQLISEDLW